jgi:glycosyltransferase involved in cell wall biosynthesis
VPADPRFEYRGYVSESEKLELMRGAVTVVNPLADESLSLIVIEALGLKVPVLVNAHCDVNLLWR